MSKSTTVTFADLTHTAVTVDANNNPLAVGYIAAYARRHLGSGITPHLFKYPEALSRFLAGQAPAIACFTTGLLDEFFDDRLTPMMQTSRGCPYACTFCHDGIAHMNKARAFSSDRIDEELAYIETRVRTPSLQLADLNWGMFPGDLRTAQRLAESRRRTGWPRNVMVATAKN